MRQATWIGVAGLCMVAAGAMAQDATAPGRPPRPQPALVQVATGERPIRLTHAGIDIYVEGSLVHTVIVLTLANPNARTLEGEMQFPLHAGQTVTGFALDMADGSMRQAVPVPKARGREVFEEVVRRGVDPALLEQTAGENFRLRVYPLRPGASRQVRIAITEWLTPGAQQRMKLALPLDFAGTPADVLDLHARLHATGAAGVRVGEVDGAKIDMSGEDTDVRLRREDFRPTAEQRAGLEMSWPAPQGDTLLRERVDGQGYFHAELQVPDQPAPRARPDDVTLIWDASGSGAKRDHEAELRLLAALFAWSPDVKVRLRVVRDAAEPERLFDVRHGDWHALADALRQVAYDGASNASLWTAPTSRSPGTSLALLFSDGLGNWGPPPTTGAGNVAAYAVQSGSGGSAVFLRQWAEARGGRLIDLATLSGDDALRPLQQRGTRLVRIDGAGFDQPAVASWRPDAGRLVLAGRFTGANARLDLVLESGDGTPLRRTVTLMAPPQGDSVDAGFVAQRWARLRIDELLAQADLHRTEIVALGNRFGIVTPETSLIVLEALSDYQRYGIVPPAGPLRDAYDANERSQAAAKVAESSRHLATLVERYREWQAWWDKDFPKDAPQQVTLARTEGTDAAARASNALRERVAPAGSPPAPAPAPPPSLSLSAVAAAPSGRRDETRRVEVTGSGVARVGAVMKDKKSVAESVPEIHIAVQAWSPDAAGTRRLAQAADADRYAVYLDQRLAAPSSPAFYLDAAQVFAAHGQRALALRVLSNLAELHLEDRGLLRVLAYRLQDIGEPAEAIRLLQRVTELAPDEPQSWRDLGLAQAAAGAWQPAVDALWTAASGHWNPRFGDMDIIALTELDAVAALHRVDLSAVDERLRRNLPLDVRVALAWDTDNTDIDLWVKDPNGEWVSYSHTLSRQGGRNTRDVTQGYGPEVFSLRKAMPGTYEVHARYFGSHRQALGNGTSVMMRLTTGFGTRAEKHRDVILRLEEAKDDVLVGTFEVK